MELPDTNYGVSPETESSWQECLSETHVVFLVDFCQRAEATEQAVVEEFLSVGTDSLKQICT
jgi:hypothetical protein